MVHRITKRTDRPLSIRTQEAIGGTILRKYGFLIAGFAVLSVLGTALLLTSLPLCDEGYYGVPAYFLAAQGILKSPVMETAGISVMTGIHTALYWMAPLGMVIQAAAFSLLGASLYVQRTVSLVAALVVLGCWFVVVRKLLNERIAGLACLLLSCDLIFLSLAVRGRSDMLSLCFGTAALASYLALRERGLSFALLAANSCCAVSGMIHPNGGISAVTCLMIVAFALDRQSLSWRHVSAVLVPYVVGAAGWGIWIGRHPDYFVDQFLGNVRNRAPRSFWNMLDREMWRYLYGFGFNMDDWYGRLRIFMPLTYGIAVVGCIWLRRAVPRLAIFLVLALAQAVALFLFEGAKQMPYLLHSMPVLNTLLAVWLIHLARRRNPLARATLLYQAAVPVVVVCALFYVASKRKYQEWYAPVTQYLNAHLTPGTKAIVASDFFFDLRCHACMVDDRYMGTYSGLQPNFIVIDYDYAADIAVFQEFNPPIYQHIRRMLNSRYTEVFGNPAFHVYRRNDGVTKLSVLVDSKTHDLNR